MTSFKNFNYSHEFFKIFCEIAKIPHGSGNTEPLAQYCVDFATRCGCSVFRDNVGNVIIKTCAKGIDRDRPIIIQGHLDMVCEKTADSKHDFLKDPLKLKYDGRYIFAENTSLGADDGIAVAYCLSLLKEESVPLPPFEILLTVDEEIGLIGASNLDGSFLSGDMLINLDSEEEGYLTVGCAGGLTAKVSADLSCCEVKGDLLKVSVFGLAGGHSGVEIHKGRLNAAKLLASILADIDDINLISFVSGSKNNAIPCRAEAELIVSPSNLNKAEELIRSKFDEVVNNMSSKDDEPRLEVAVQHDITANAATVSDSLKVISYLSTVKDGVISADDTGVVTSLNTGISTYHNSKFYSEALLRSTVNSDLNMLSKDVGFTADEVGFSAEFSDRYPAWEYRPDSPLRDTMVDVYADMFGIAPIVQTIHAGLECGIISEKTGGLDAVSIGPDILDVHSVNEKLDIESAVRCWEYLLNVLQCIA